LAGNRVNGAAIITFTDDEITTAQVSIDDTNYVAAVTGVTTLSDITGFNALGEGNFTLYLRDTDTAGNIGTDTEINVVKDSDVPQSTVSVDSDPIYEGDLVQIVTVTYDEAMNPAVTPTIGFAGNSGAITTQSDGAWTVGNTVWTETFDVADVNEETATVTVTSSGAEDLATNTEGVSTDDTFAIDTKAPVVDITYPLAGNRVNGAAVITFTDDELTAAECSVDGTNYTAVISGTTTLSAIVNFNGLGEGNFTLYLRDTDTAGNVGVDSEVNVIKDSDLPQSTVVVDTDPIYEGDLVQIVTVTYDEAMNPAVTPTITFTDNVGAITTQSDGAWTVGNTVWTETFDVADVNEETATVTVTSSGAEDIAGNGEGVSTDDTFAIDTKAPTVNITYPLTTDRVNNSDVLTFTDDELTAAEVSIDDTNYVAAVTGTTTMDDITGFDAMPEGSFTLYLRDTDTAGNIGTDTEVNVVKDVDAPAGTVTVDSDPIYEGDLVQIVTVTYDEAMNPAVTPVVGFAGNVGAITTQSDGAWTVGNTVWTETFDVADVNEETATVTVSSSGGEDLGGNPEGPSITDTFAIDTKAPAINITNPLSGQYVNGTVVITFTDDELTVAEVSIDDTNYVAAATGVTTLSDITGFNALGEGNFTLYLRDTDLVGNNSTDSEINVVKDTDVPQSTVSVDTDPIYEGDLVQIVTVTYDEAMNPLVTPVVGFASNVGAITTQGDGAWTVGNTVWTETFDVTDANEETATVTVSSSGGQDLAANTEGVSTADTFAIDTAAPVVNITYPLAGNRVNGTAVITFTDDDLTAAEVSIDGTNYVAAISGTTTMGDITGFNALGEGNFTLYLRDTDLVGNTGTDTEVNVVKDTSSPTGTVGVDTNPVFEGDLVQQVSITYDEVMDPSSIPTINFVGNTGAITTQANGMWVSGNTIWTETFDVTDVNEETAMVTVSCSNGEDLAGNVEGVSITTSFVIDTRAPAVNITAPLSGQYVNASVVITFTDDDLTNAQVSIDGTNYVAVVSGTTTLSDITGFNALGEGNFTLYLRDTDTAGNIGTDTEVNVVKDTDDPQATISVDTDPIYESDLVQQVTLTYDETMNPAVTPTINFASNVGAITTQSDGAWTVGNTVWTETFDVTDVNEETATVTVSCVNGEDLAGNVEGASITAAFAIDTRAPSVNITVPLTGNYVTSGTIITFTDDELTNAQVSIDDTNYVIAVSGTTTMGDITGFNALIDGNFTVYLRDTDTAGNVGTDSEVNVIKDSGVPIGTVTIDTDPVYQGDLAQIVTVTYNELMNPAVTPTIGFAGNLGVITTQGDGVWSGGNTIWAETFDVADADEETATVTVTSSGAEDLVGFAEGVCISDSFAIDTLGPIVDITYPLNGNYVNGSEAITFTDDTLNNPECSVNGSAYVAAVSGTTTLNDITGFSGFSDGTFTLYVRDTDAAGNVTTDIEVNIVKDTTAPSGSITSPLDGFYYSANPGLIASATDGGSGVESVKFQYKLSTDISYTDLNTDYTSPYVGDWGAVVLTPGLSYHVQAVVTDNVSRQTTTSAVLFTIAEVSLDAAVLSNSPYTVGDPAVISGTAIVSGNVALEYSTTGPAGAYVSLGSGADNVSVSSQAFSYNWTVSNGISTNVYIKVRDIDTGAESISGAVIIRAKFSNVNLSAAASGSYYTVGESVTISWTTDGTVADVKLEYYTGTYNESLAPDIETSVANNGSYSWTVPDYIASGVIIRITDAVAGHPEATGDSSAFEIKGILAVNTPASGLYASQEYDLTWDVTGDVGNIKIEYQTSSDNGATDPYSGWADAVASTDSDWITGQGVSAQSGTYRWTVTDAVLAEVGAANVQSDPDVYMRIRIVDEDDSTVYAESNGFIVRYHSITWHIIDSNGSTVAGLNVEETSTATPQKQAWSITNSSFDGNNTVRYYPNNASVADEANYTSFSFLDNGTIYSKDTGPWRADSDKTLTYVIDTATTIAISYNVNVNAVYDADNDAIDISVWMTSQGELVERLDILTDLTAITVDVFDELSVQLNGSDLGSGITANVNGIFSDMTYNPAGGLDVDASYIIRAQVTHKGQTYTGATVFVIPNIVSYEVRLTVAHHSANDSMLSNVWLERNGTAVDTPGDLTLTIYDNVGSVVSTQTFDGYDSVGDGTYDSSLNNGVYTNLEWDPLDGIPANTLYTVKAEVVYRSKTYIGIESFTKTETSTIATDLAEITAEIDAVKTQVGSVATQMTSLTGEIGDVKTAVDETLPEKFGQLETDTSKILTATGDESLSDKISSVSDELSDDVQPHITSGILNRNVIVKQGETVNIRYRTDSGLSPTIEVYDSSNIKKVNLEIMTEVTDTGIYERLVTFHQDWGLGEFNVICSETTQGTADAITITVVAHDIEDIANKTSAILGETAGSSDSGLADDIDVLVAQLESQFGAIESSLLSMTADMDIGDGSDGVSESELDTVYQQLVLMSEQIKKLSQGELFGLASLEEKAEVEVAKKDDIMYLKNKTQELKAILELNNKMIDDMTSTPEVQVWYEFR
ncbi:MAG: hypothetical protein GY853_14965, partial [PVC group bacterium]|nr:hypothetical protein [PVC group bacterium]